MPTNNSRTTDGAASAKHWLLQQGGNFWIVESAEMPDLTPKEGERLIVQRGAYPDRAAAERRLERLSKMTVL